MKVTMLRLWGLQRWRLGRVIVVLVLTVVLLQLVHMMLLTRLEAREGALHSRGGRGAPGGSGGAGVGRQLQGRTVKNVITEMHERVKNSYRLDKSGTYHVIDNFLTSEHVVLENAHDVTLVTQCSANHLHNLVEVSERWKGPVSVAVFTFDDDFSHTIDTILYHHFCSDSVFKYVTFHLVFPISRTPKDLGSAAKAAEARLSCSQPPEIDKSQAFANYAIKGIEYPHNVLRNLAINYVQTRYVFVVDVDMLPSEDLRPQFQKFLARLEMENGTSLKTAYVVPSFEVKPGVAVPSTKEELIKAWSQWTARPFYSELCAKCQRPTDFERWRNLALGPGLRIAYSQEWKDPWEPFYISRASLPLYDERFKQYGFNRISQVCEMYVAGYSFAVLDNAFLVHRGFKSQTGFHPTKEEEQNQNRALFRKFKEELKTKYPESSRRC